MTWHMLQVGGADKEDDVSTKRPRAMSISTSWLKPKRGVQHASRRDIGVICGSKSQVILWCHQDTAKVELPL